MYEFVRTEKGWVIYWGPNPAAEADSASAAVPTVPPATSDDAKSAGTVPVASPLREAGALGPMAV